MTEDNTVRDLNSGAPYRKTALKYYRKGWLPLPLPHKEKFPPPTGWTGHTSKPVDQETIDAWRDDPSRRKANVGLMMPEAVEKDGKRWIVIAIDVDDYEDGTDKKRKRGGEQFAELLNRYGPLPDTWTSSPRGDGVSGQRFFLAPEGFTWRGKADKDIDIIQPHHRFSAVWPSYHPKGGQYQWFEPGVRPQGLPTADAPYVGTVTKVNGSPGTRKMVFTPGEADPIPFVEDLPYLPDQWVEYLTNRFMPFTPGKIDMDSSSTEIEEWAKSKFAKGNACKDMKAKVQLWKDRIKEDPSSHDKILGAHHQFMVMGIKEGHPGAAWAIRTLTNYWVRNVAKRGKRAGLQEAKSEAWRSTTMGYRKLKAEVEEWQQQGIQFQSKCTCYEEKEMGGDNGPVPPGLKGAKDPGEYEQNDDGNGDHLMDLYIQNGEHNLIWIPGLGQWVFWNGTRWARDDDGLARRCFRRVKERQFNFGDTLLNAYLELRAIDPDGQPTKDAGKKWRDWMAFARSSGNNRTANAALEAATNNIGATVQEDRLDGDIHLLGFDNGILEMGPDGATFRAANRSDFVTLSTNVEFVPLETQVRSGGEPARGVRMWQSYLERFIPDEDLRRFVQKVFGYCLLGRNTERLGIFLQGDTSTGKSTILEAIMAALGDYASPVEMEIFKDRALNPGLAQALPRRIITTTEAGAANNMHADTFKRMTGNDMLTAELKGVNTIIRRVPAFVPVIATNSSPNIEGADEALGRRLLVIPFDQKVTRDDVDPSASGNLRETAKQAVAAWMVDGYQMYAREGLKQSEWPIAVTGRTAEFVHGLNDIGEFVADHVELALGENVSSREVYDRYVQWATVDQNIEKPYAMRGFTNRMKEQGYAPKVVKAGKTTVRAYPDIKLKESTQTSINIRRKK